MHQQIALNMCLPRSPWCLLIQINNGYGGAKFLVDTSFFQFLRHPFKKIQINTDHLSFQSQSEVNCIF